jgi:CHAT domain-containing protein/tetratricopeptide (TPR) repeat protein
MRRVDHYAAAAVLGWQFAIALAQAAPALPLTSCTGLAHVPHVGDWVLELGASGTAGVVLALPSNRSVVLDARESGVDVTLEVTAAPGVALVADNPVRRSGVQRALIHTGPSGAVTVTARAKLHAGVGSRLYLRAIDAETPALSEGCRAVLESIAAADSAYASAQKISNGQAGATVASAADLFGLARRNYQLAFSRLDTETEGALRAELAHAIAATLYQDLQQWQESAQWSARAAALFATAHDAYGRARAEALQAAAWMELAALPNPGTAAEVRRHESHELLERAENLLVALARFHEKRGEFLDAALQRNNFGLASYYEGAYEASLRAYAQALTLYEKLGYTYGQAQVTQNMALAERDLGRVSTALTAYQHALQLISVAESPKLYAKVLNNCGLANATAGHLDIALEQHAQALELGKRIQSPSLQVESLFGIAMVYTLAGDGDQAREFLHEALEMWDENTETRIRVGALRLLASVEAQHGQFAESIRLERAALGIATESVTRIRLLVQIADTESLLAQTAAAGDDLTLAARIAAHAGPVSRAAVDLEHGMLEFRQGHLDTARHFTQAALRVDRALGLNGRSFDALVALARIETAAGRREIALQHLDQGLNLSEILRVQAANPELRATSMQPLRPAFDLEVELWAQRSERALAAGDRAGAERAARAALKVTERSRARAMQDIALTHYGGTSTATLGPLLTRKSELIQDIAAHEDRLEAGDAQAESRSPTLRRDISHLREQLALVDSRLAALSQHAHADRGGSALALDRVPTDTAIVAYWVGESRTYAWVVSHSALRLVALGSSTSLRQAARAAHVVFSDLTTTSGAERLGADEELSRAMLQPLLPLVPADIRRLVIIPDGPLHYVSFAVLPMRADARDSFLVRRYELAYGPSIGSLLAKGVVAGATDDSLLLVDDAVYGSDDPRLANHPDAPLLALAAQRPRLRSGPVATALERLPATAAEGAAIARAAAPRSVDRLEGFAATRDAVLGRPLERYRYIHFAVHAATDARIPQLSSLILSTHDPSGRPIEDHIWAGDLLTRQFNARVVVLSACETALGPDIAGEGLLGLRYVVLARGAQAVIASLWAVPDRATGLLMQKVYTGLLSQQERPEMALASAMRQTLDEGTRDPALWAAFTATVGTLN